MSKRDTSHIVKGARLIGGVYPGMRMVKGADPPPKYGAPPSFKQVAEQLDDAKRRLEKLRDQVRDARRR